MVASLSAARKQLCPARRHAQDGGYHVGLLHKDLASSLDLEHYKVDVHDGYSVQSCHGKLGETRVDGAAVYGVEQYAVLWTLQDALVAYWLLSNWCDRARVSLSPPVPAFLHPNLMTNRYGPWLDTNVVYPIDENRYA